MCCLRLSHILYRRYHRCRDRLRLRPSAAAIVAVGRIVFDLEIAIVILIIILSVVLSLSLGVSL